MKADDLLNFEHTREEPFIEDAKTGSSKSQQLQAGQAVLKNGKDAQAFNLYREYHYSRYRVSESDK